jgi:hypothetical protein
MLGGDLSSPSALSAELHPHGKHCDFQIPEALSERADFRKGHRRAA